MAFCFGWFEWQFASPAWAGVSQVWGDSGASRNDDRGKAPGRPGWRRSFGVRIDSGGRRNDGAGAGMTVLAPE